MTTDTPPSQSPTPETVPKKRLAHQAYTQVIKPMGKYVIRGSGKFYQYLLGHSRKIDLKNKSRQRRFVVATVTLFLMWLFLVGTFSWSESLVGLVVAMFTAWLSSNHLTMIDSLKFQWAMPWHILRYLQVFVVALVRANIDMARRVLSPNLPINPALVEVQTQLQSSLGKLVLANSITLTPGTLTVDVVGDRLQVHWIDSTPGVDLEHATHAIAQSFERHLREFVE